jgi:hypothetical protein
MEGIIGQFFYAFGLTVVFATLFSIFISFTLAPLLAARLLRTNETEHEETEGPARAALAALGRGLPLARGQLPRRLAGRSRGRATAGSSSARSSCSRWSRSSWPGASSAASSSRPATRARSAWSSSCRPARRWSAPPRWRCAAEQRIAARWTTSSRCSPPSPAAAATFMGCRRAARTRQILVTLRDDARAHRRGAARAAAAAGRPAGRGVTAARRSRRGGRRSGADPAADLRAGLRYAARSWPSTCHRRAGAVPQLSDVNNTLEAPRTELVFRPDRAALADYGLTVGAGRAGAARLHRGHARRRLPRRGRPRARHPRAPGRGRAAARDAGGRAAGPHAARHRAARGARRARRGESPTAIQRMDRVRTVEINAQIGQGTLTDAVAAIEERMEAHAAAARLRVAHHRRVRAVRRRARRRARRAAARHHADLHRAGDDPRVVRAPVHHHADAAAGRRRRVPRPVPVGRVDQHLQHDGDHHARRHRGEQRDPDPGLHRAAAARGHGWSRRCWRPRRRGCGRS